MLRASFIAFDPRTDMKMEAVAAARAVALSGTPGRVTPAAITLSGWHD